ncbi:hypothetical protein B0T20DRAFT_363150, partial [Sordaria brevicollis]
IFYLINLKILYYNVAKLYNRIKITLKIEERYKIIVFQELGRIFLGNIFNSKVFCY